MKLYTCSNEKGGSGRPQPGNEKGVEEHEIVHSPAMKKGVGEHEIGGRGQGQEAAEAGGESTRGGFSAK